MIDFKLALIQFAVSDDKLHNLSRLGNLIHQAAQNNAKMVILPECFNSPYGNAYFKRYSENISDGPSMTTLSNLSKQHHLYIVGGSIPEHGNNEKFMNTCMVFDPFGRMIKVYRKMHLFDIDIPGKMTFKESETLSPGNELGIVETEYGKICIGICYDVRFPELASLACSHGCFMMIYPGAFNTVTGPLHWHLLMRTRALDQLMYVSAVSPARNPQASYQAYGHSMVVDPL